MVSSPDAGLPYLHVALRDSELSVTVCLSQVADLLLTCFCQNLIVASSFASPDR